MLYFFIGVKLERTITYEKISLTPSKSVFVFEIWHSPEISACWLGAGACKRLSWWHQETGRWWRWWWWRTRPSRWTVAEQRRSTCPVCVGMAYRRGIKSIRLQLVQQGSTNQQGFNDAATSAVKYPTNKQMGNCFRGRAKYWLKSTVHCYWSCGTRSNVKEQMLSPANQCNSINAV